MIELLLISTTSVLILCASLFNLLNVFLLFEVLAASFLSPSTAFSQTKELDFRVLIPAHDEEKVIESTLCNLLPEVASAYQICVVADNCTDRTAEIARCMGVEVLERFDANHRGKGYALDFGLTHLAQNPPDVVIIVDADCHVGKGTLAKIAGQALVLSRPVQAVYKFLLPPEPSTRDRISSFALTVKNRVRAGGLSYLGCPILLGGTGMAFPWKSLQAVDLASDHIVEDMKLGIDLAISGHNPFLSTETLVISRLPSGDVAAKTQRTRWEHGHLQVLSTYVPQLVQVAFARKRFELLALALDLTIPPLALWTMIGFILTLLTGGLAIFVGADWPLILQSCGNSIFVLAVALAWVRWGREDVSPSQILTIPLYILWKIPIYFKFVLRPEQSWIRTERDK